MSEPFDVLQRFQAIADALAALPLRDVDASSSAHLVLDVGGFPGRLADYMRGRGFSTLTIDTPACDRDDYVQGRGESLPFADASFPVVVTSDTLEHIPPAARASFLSELARVAKRWVIVSGPLYSPIVDHVEERLDSLYRNMHAAPHPWLVEHREYGLPRWPQIVQVLGPLGSLRTLPNAHLANVALMLGARLIDDTWPVVPERESPAATIESAYSTARAVWPPDDALPCYRTLVVLDKCGDKGLVDTSALDPEQPERPGDRWPIHLILTLLESLAAQAKAHATTSDSSTWEAYAKRLEAASHLAPQGGRIGRFEQLVRRLFGT